MYNGDWLSKLTFTDIIGLASNFTVQQFLVRENFALRFEKGEPIWLHEFMYALMQGYDAVAMKTDIQIGGTDQLFNLIAGRKLMESFGLRPQTILTFPILVGTDGVLRMTKSTGNHIGISEAPEVMFGKVMSIPDNAMRNYADLVTRWSPDEIREKFAALERGELHPRDLKMQLAFEIVDIFQGPAAAETAQEHFRKVFQQRELPSEMPELRLLQPISLLDLLTNAGLAPIQERGAAPGAAGRRQARRRARRRLQRDHNSRGRACAPGGAPQVLEAHCVTTSRDKGVRVSPSFHGLRTRSLTNGRLNLEYLDEAGPRIVHLSRAGTDENLMAEVPDIGIPTAYGTFRLYGGHRLWHSPEAMPRSYVPDDGGCIAELIPDGVLLSGPVETPTGIKKSLRVQLAPDRAAVTVTHRLENCGSWPVELAPWAITQLRLGGVAIFPQTQGKLDGPGLLPNRNLVLWPYTRLADPRLSLNDDLCLLHADPDAHPVKIGYLNRAGWAAYLTGGVLFVKRWTPQPEAEHVDFGCNCESYCNDRFIEVETVGPLASLAPGETATHMEEWELLSTEGIAPTLDGVRELVTQLGLM